MGKNPKTAKKTPTDPFSADEHAYYESLRTSEPEPVQDDSPFGGADRWSIWYDSEPLQRGPEPHPEWLVTTHGAVDFELGVLKTGKEADVVLLERTDFDTGRSVLMASKRYRTAEHKLFHRSADYTATRQMKKSRDQRALNKRSAFGRQVAATQWAMAEFGALTKCYEAGLAVPYPVQVHGTELLMEFIGNGRAAAPRLAEVRADRELLLHLWDQVVHNLDLLTSGGLAHGDLSAYNIVVDENDDIVLLDLPQVVDIYMNPKGFEFLERDVANIGAWFVSKGLDEEYVEDLHRLVMKIALR
ncbi:serine protein kinase RIO [Salininema proteolyticum]|uniref:non-specific serine/threonine protein kinase n=1 Tax=Salininema proteolyticum TaxID=1607685 RepID=A0ABV8TY32_9ACTN